MRVMDDVLVQAARQRKRDATAAEASSQTQDNSMLDDIQLDDDDTVDPVELVAGAGVRGRLDEDVEEVDTTHGLVGIHEAILMSIDKCGKSLSIFKIATICHIGLLCLHDGPSTKVIWWSNDTLKIC